MLYLTRHKHFWWSKVKNYILVNLWTSTFSSEQKKNVFFLFIFFYDSRELRESGIHLFIVFSNCTLVRMKFILKINMRYVEYECAYKCDPILLNSKLNRVCFRFANFGENNQMIIRIHFDLDSILDISVFCIRVCGIDFIKKNLFNRLCKWNWFPLLLLVFLIFCFLFFDWISKNVHNSQLFIRVGCATSHQSVMKQIGCAKIINAKKKNKTKL